ncbi:hypothetical protein MUO74_11505 [Candidatus Bathyarchaeota archaeon]|nr:hypothetical protein [Candidatus Bathyarchaeota archaeon]
MPRIRCSIRPLFSRKPFPFVTFFVRTLHISKPVDALIDTGSPFTVLSTNDILSTRMAITKMQSGATVTLAGYRFFNHPIKDATMNFRMESDELFKVNLPTIGSLIPTKIDKKTMDEVKYIPSIIGNDFLENQKLALYFSPSARVVYLEY